MRNLQARKWISPSLLALLGLTLWLLFLPSGLVRADPPDPPPPTPVWEKLDPPYPPSEVSPPLAPLSVQGTLKAFQAVADAEVRQGNPAENFGIEPIMGAGYDNYTPENRLIQRALLRFDVSHFLPPGSTIHQATLSLYMVGYCDVGSSTFQTYRVTDDWFELTTTWNNQPSFAEGYGSTVIPVGGTTFGWYTFDVTALVQAWVNGDYPEYGLMIRGPEAPPYQCAFREFLTKGGGGFNSAPELVVDYTAPPPALAVSQNDLTFLHQCGIGAPAPLPQVIAVQSNDE
ncbi:MAG: DNRLRE domain-containing protein, partial [Anaerolineae bacterium]